MMWLGIIVGLLLGAAFGSFPAALLFAALGGVVGHFIFRDSSDAGRSNSTRVKSASASPGSDSLENQVKILKEQVRSMGQRLSALEQQLQSGAAAVMQVTPLTETEVEVDTDTVDHAELTRQALATTPDDILSRRAQPAPENLTPPVESSAPIATSAALNIAADSVAHTAASPEPLVPSPAVNSETLSPAIPPVSAQQSTPAARPTKPAAYIAPAAPAAPTWLNTFIQRWVIGGNPLLKVGVLILFLGLAFLLRYVAENTVVPIEWRYAGVAATGIALLLGGWRWRHRADNYGLILQGAGIGVMYLITLAAMKLHPLIPLNFGFAILFAVAAFAALLAILQNSLALAVIGALGGFAAPVLTSTGHAHHIPFFTYLAVINLGIVAIAWFKAWRVLNLIGFVCTVVLGAAWADKYYQPELWLTCEPFLMLLFVMYVLITFLFARRTLAQAPESATAAASFEQHALEAAARVGYVDGTLAFGVPFATFAMQYLLVKQFEYGAAFSALGFGLLYIVMAFMLFRRSGMRYALLSETMIALAVVFGSLAIPLGLEQTWTSAAWAVEAAGVYWVGIRQQRVHARLFALLLLFGSAFYFAMGVGISHVGPNLGPNLGPVLDGSLLGSIMLALSTWWVYRLQRSAPQDALHGFEMALRPWLIAAGAFFVALLPFLIWPMNWASTALAILGTVAVFAAQRLSERALLYWGCLYQAVAGALFMTTLHAPAGGSVLANGWTGLLSASLIGASMLAGVWAMTRAHMRNAAEGTSDAEQAPAAFGGIASMGLLAGLVFINLAPLFVLPWRYAAMVWPLTGIATLWWAVRVRHSGAIGFALALQVVAGMAHFGSRLFAHGGTADLVAVKPFLHSGYWGPVLISLAAFVCARLLQKKAAKALDISLGWIALFWAGAWWSFSWADEIVRVVGAVQADMVIPCLVEIAVVTAWLWSALARRLDWRQLGLATLAYLPALIILAAVEWLSPVAHPLAGWGALAWPLALLMHCLLLRRQSAWVSVEGMGLAHTVGAWLFVVLAAMELRWQFAHWASADSAWPLLGWMIAPVIYLWCLTSSKLQRSWPLREHHDAYVVVSALPMVGYLFGWIWITNAISNGTAAPLPFVPLLNPLEIAQVAVLLGITSWWWSLLEHEPAHALFKHNKPAATALIGATAMAMLTGSVVRTCHHWGQVAWKAEALIASNLVQTSLSVVWSIVAIGLMMFGNRKKQRWVWIVGAGLIAVVVAKLFLVELAAKGSLARIVSFIVVGLLLLLVGYFAPLPPKQEAAASSDPESIPPSTEEPSAA